MGGGLGVGGAAVLSTPSEQYGVWFLVFCVKRNVSSVDIFVLLKFKYIRDFNFNGRTIKMQFCTKFDPAASYFQFYYHRQTKSAKVMFSQAY